MTEICRKTPDESDGVDVRALIALLWSSKRFIMASVIAALLLAAVYAFILAKPVFVSSALLIPTQTPSSEQLGAAAALLGKKSGAASADIDLYQSLLTSRTVLQKLLRAPIIDFSDTSHPHALPLLVILGVDTAKPKEMDEAISNLARSIKVNSKESGVGGIIEIKFEANTPWLAQQVGNSVLQIGQDELRLVRIARSQVIMSRLETAVSQARGEWDSAARIVTTYKDANRSISLPEQMLELSRLEMDKSAKEQKYLLARKEYESQMLEREKAAPPMMILDSANKPSRKQKPKRILILAVGCLFGFFSATTGVIAYHALAKPRDLT